MPLPDQGDGLPVLSLRDQRHVSLDIHPGRTGEPAGRQRAFVDGVEIGDRLGIELVDDLARPESLVELVRQLHRTDRLAVPAGVALHRIHEGGVFQQGEPEIPRFPPGREHLGIGDDLDVGVSGRLNEPGG